jgi:DNA polymerase
MEKRPVMDADHEVERWTERQRALLAEMGIQRWDVRLPRARSGGADPEPQPDAPPIASLPKRHATPASRPLTSGSPVAPVPGVAEVADLPDVTTLAMARGSALGVGPGLSAGQPERAPTSDAPTLPAMPHDWPALREAVRECRACELCQARKHTVFGAGSTQATWMIVGEAPGEEEDRRGEPFVGRAGQLIDQMLRATRLTRSEEVGEGGPALRQVFITNTVKCRPPSNRNPNPAELAQCAPYLERQIELLKPRILLAMGRFAAQALLGSTEPLGRLRGRVHDRQGIPVIVTYHPAYLLRNPQDKALAWEDLCLAHDTYQRQFAAG